MLAVFQEDVCAFYLFEGEVVLAVLCTQEGVFYLCEGEVYVGCSVYPGRHVLPV